MQYDSWPTTPPHALCKAESGEEAPSPPVLNLERLYRLRKLANIRRNEGARDETNISEGAWRTTAWPASRK
jgi:hypothetical protein